MVPRLHPSVQTFQIALLLARHSIVRHCADLHVWSAGHPFRQSLVPLLWSRSGKPEMAASTRCARPHAAVLMYLGLASLPLGTAAATEVDCYSGNGATYNGTRSRTATGAGAAQTTPAHSRMPAVHAMRVATRSVEIRLCRCTRCCRHGVHGMGAQQAPRRGARAGPLAVRALGAVAEQPALELLPQPERRLATMVLHRRRVGLLRRPAMPNRERYTPTAAL